MRVVYRDYFCSAYSSVAGTGTYTNICQEMMYSKKNNSISETGKTISMNAPTEYHVKYKR